MIVRLALILLVLVVARVGLADDDLAPEIYGDPGQKLAPPPVKREPRYKVELIKSPKVELSDARAKLRELAEKLTNRNLNYTERSALQAEFAAEGLKVKTIEAQLAKEEADEIARGIADEKAAEERIKKEKAEKRKAEEAEDAKEAKEKGGRSGAIDGPSPAAPSPAASPAPDASPAASPAPDASPAASPAPEPSPAASPSPAP